MTFANSLYINNQAHKILGHIELSSPIGIQTIQHFDGILKKFNR